MDPQPHPLLHFLVRMKPTSTNVFLQVAKNMEVIRGKIWTVRKMLKCFRSNLWSLSLTKLAIWGWAFGRFDFMALRSTLSHLEMNQCVPMLDEHTLHYAHPQSKKERTMWFCAFSLCMSPILQMTVSIRNNSVASFCEECVLWRVFGFHLTPPYSSREKVHYVSTILTFTR